MHHCLSFSLPQLSFSLMFSSRIFRPITQRMCCSDIRSAMTGQWKHQVNSCSACCEEMQYCQCWFVFTFAGGVSTRTIIIAAVCGGVGALLLLLLVVLVIICIVTRTPSAGPKPERLEKAVGRWITVDCRMLLRRPSSLFKHMLR